MKKCILIVLIIASIKLYIDKQIEFLIDQQDLSKISEK
jgi:hypothetical protein